ncbi:DUF2809 domain-containing protein [Clostridium sp. 'deep sea']|uniref:ribosomal maturation YjgA family protein n=1 Tax=Clostridium sp. 'deep sea' TaxID=2779445 RepID=UPI0018963EA9|nr:DUF2809 domain-containing protein [Clostridium sp. 'deep sea']QOR35862.1 DUF2809 domain-containing protein [Clostridium sp. 'deep sea']
MRFNKKYFAFFLVLFLTELFIALYIKDNFIRPYVGDVLVILLMYSFVRCFVKSFQCLPILLFVVAFLVEISQYFNFIAYLGLQNCRIANIILGLTFDVKDIFCYFIGMLLCMALQKFTKNYQNI